MTAWMAAGGPHLPSTGMRLVPAWCCGQSQLLALWSWSDHMHAARPWMVRLCACLVNHWRLVLVQCSLVLMDFHFGCAFLLVVLYSLC